QRGRKNMVLRKRGVLVPAEAKSTELRIIQRVRFGRIANRVPAKQAIGRRKDLVHAPLPIVVSGRLGERKRELVFGKIRRRKQVQNGRGHRRNGRGRYTPQLRTGRISDHRARREIGRAAGREGL